jgi:hypothetical protein
LATAIAGGARIANPDLPDILLILEQPPFYTLSISQIFLNKKRRNLKKRETIDRYSFERRNQGRGEQKNGEMGSPRITVCRPRRYQKKEKVNQYRGKLGQPI